ncbi:carbon-nitrogen hydrolase family protein [Aliidiomarina maris]|uniref:Amidohydrolase n=1 Tax=Aliidiomarina maris TaxID=531312 RepID=A0A327X291_9GAMM|nr:carbon-nitrogen hydrolase family protein [Aliidiomarina maris]RAJ99244.1 putative amidohydrolase [Aliidiomarina maris]RUO27611.1 amidohydrolase [Aliidiomarina maris]
MAQISVVQWTSGNKPEQNLEQLRRLLRLLPPQRPQLVVLPEAFASFGAGESSQLERAEVYGDGPIQQAVAELARQHDVWIVAGTIPVKAGKRYSAASMLFNNQGEAVARYNKIHLFDATVEDGTGSYQESKYTQPGDELVLVDTPFGRIGMAVCYDLRFPEMFRALRAKGAEVIVLPSAFTKVTGKAHWQPLLQARAIENQCYMVAPNQGGEHPDGRETWGHSMVIDPWGKICTQISSDIGVGSVPIDPTIIQDVRRRMPVEAHNQFKVSFNHAS